MPTGYTADLENRKYDVKGWLKENVIRAMGVCVSLRDEGRMTVKDIKNALKKDLSEPYHTKRVRESKANLTEFQSLSDAELKIRYAKERDAAKIDFIKRKKEFDEKKAAHLKAITETSTLYNQAIQEKQGEVIVNTLKFALEQLNSAFNFDYGSGPYRDKILDHSFEEWIAETDRKLNWDVDYHTKESARENTRTDNRLNEYTKFVDWID